MTLYYEDDPADDSTPPQLPPLLRAVAVPDGQDVLSKAVALAANSEVGTVFYSENTERMEIAVRLAPEVPTRQAGQMLFALMIGLGDLDWCIGTARSCCNLSIAWLRDVESWARWISPTCD